MLHKSVLKVTPKLGYWVGLEAQASASKPSFLRGGSGKNLLTCCLYRSYSGYLLEESAS